MRAVHTLLLLAILLASGFNGLSALEVKDGSLKLVLHEETGRFSLYARTDPDKERYEALFVDQDPRTSFVGLLLDDRALRLGETSAFRIKTGTDETGAYIRFDSASLQVAEHFTFIKTLGSEKSDGVRLDITIENQSTRQLSVGLRILIDTMLGEKENAHFTTELREIKEETLIEPKKEADIWWFSRNERLGMMGSISVKGATRADLVHFANWKRLSDEPWKILASKGRNFNFLPYSVNDSAVSYYFDPRSLPVGAQKTYTVVFAMANPAGLSESLAGTGDEPDEELMTRALKAASSDYSLYTDLQALKELVDRINASASGEVPLSDDEIAELEKLLQLIAERNQLK